MKRTLGYLGCATPALLLVLCLLVAFPAPVLAIADPDTAPQVTGVYVYEDLLEDGDAGVLIDYYLDYAVLPSETATEAYLAVFLDTDGTTQLKSVAPYTFVDSGYGRGLIWIYFLPSEVSAFGIDRASLALYRVWLMGNPTLGWTGDPPKTVATIDYWQPVGSSTSVLLALRVLYFADVLELAWSLDMITETSLGNRLTSTGESYFMNVIPSLRTMAPSAFSAGTIEPTLEDLDYSTAFGANITDGTGQLAVSPLILVPGANTVTVNVVGTFFIDLVKGTVGLAEDGVGGIITGSPVGLVYGTNTIDTTGAGTIIVTVVLEDTQTGITDTITGTGLDVTGAATELGLSVMMTSGIIWLIVTVLICAASLKIPHVGGKGILLVFDVCIIGGAVLGLMTILVAALMFIGFGILTGYVLFFRGANL